MNKINDRKIYYKNLSPFDKIKDSYAFDALEHAIEENTILNIAVTAPYGAGKSSVIKSFFNYNTNYENKVLFISLASFNDSCFGECPNNDKSDDIAETSLENSILQQLFFTETVHTLPWSNYFRIKNYKKTDLLKITLILLLGFASLIKFGYFEKISIFLAHSFNGFRDIFPDTLKNFFAKDIFNYTTSFVFITFFIIFLYHLVKKTIEFISKIHSIKWNSIAGEIEVQKKCSSPLNDKIDEILYFFEITKYEYIVFEDLDRFESKKIFIKLRELNKLINWYNGIKPRRIKFIYALNDDVFSSRNRVKFFDFIVPIIPKISRTNVSDFFLFQENDPKNPMGYEITLLEQLDKDVINDLGYYIDDLRLLNNIQNEFFIYCKSYYTPEQLNDFFTRQKIPNKKEITELFCLILYKNLFPEDFKKCHFGNGILYKLFHEEGQIIEYCKREAILDNFEKNEFSLQIVAKLCPKHIKKCLNLDENNLVNFLITFIGRGLITKDYYSFISHIYPGELSFEDFALVKKMKSTSEIGFEDKIDNVKSVLSKTSKDMWESNAILNKYILEYICQNNQDDFISKFINSLLKHDQIDKQNQYLKKYSTIIFNEKTIPFIIENIEWKKLANFFGEENLFAFWYLIEAAKGKQDEKITNKIRYFFNKNEKIFFSEKNIKQTYAHKDLINYYGMKIKDVSCISDKVMLHKINQKNLYELNRKNLKFLYPEFNSNKVPYYQLKKNVQLYQNIKKNINDFVENIILNNYCEVSAYDLSILILNPNITRKNVAQLVSLGELAPVDLSKISPRHYDNKKDFLNKHGITALLNHKKIEYNDDTVQLLKLKYKITLPQPKIVSPELDALKKELKKRNKSVEKISFIEEYITRNSLQNHSDIVEYAIQVFLHSKEIGTSLLFASQLINKHFEYVEKILIQSSGRSLSTQILSSPYIEHDKRKRMLEIIDFPEKIISLNERAPDAAKWLFTRYESLLNDQSIVDVHKHVFGEVPTTSENENINYSLLRNNLKHLPWHKPQE